MMYVLLSVDCLVLNSCACMGIIGSHPDLVPSSLLVCVFQAFSLSYYSVAYYLHIVVCCS